MASGSIEDEAVRDALEKLRNDMPVDGAFLDQCPCRGMGNGK